MGKDSEGDQGSEMDRRMEDLYNTNLRDIVAGMRSGFRNALHLLPSVLSVLSKDRELLIIAISPLVGGAVSVALSCGWIYAVISAAESEADRAALPLFVVLLLFATLLFVMILGVLSKGALVAGAYERMMGGDPTVRSSVKAAWKHVNSLIAWGFVRIFINFLGSTIIGPLALYVATYFVVPAIVIESKRPIKAIERSVRLLRKTWGENLIGNVGLGLLGGPLILPCIVIVGVGVWLEVASTSSGVMIGVIAIAAAFGWCVVVMLSISTVDAVFKTALYVYAVTDASSTTDASFMGFKKAFLAESIVSKTKTSKAETHQPVLEPPTMQAGDGNDTDDEHQSEAGEDDIPSGNDSNQHIFSQFMQRTNGEDNGEDDIPSGNDSNS